MGPERSAEGIDLADENKRRLSGEYVTHHASRGPGDDAEQSSDGTTGVVCERKQGSGDGEIQPARLRRQ